VIRPTKQLLCRLFHSILKMDVRSRVSTELWSRNLARAFPISLKDRKPLNTEKLTTGLCGVGGIVLVVTGSVFVELFWPGIAAVLGARVS